jgi:DNA replication protein DnaC
MKDPYQEQAVVNDFIAAEVLILDDLGGAPDTAFSQQVLQEILDGRDFQDRAGLIVSSSFSLDALAQKLGRDAIPSRLAGLSQVIEVAGIDRRIRRGLNSAFP